MEKKETFISKCSNLFLLTIIVISLMGCYAKRSQSAFQQAKEKNTLEAYKSFLNEYEDSEYAVQIKEMLEALVFQNAKENGHYDWYLFKYPNGVYASEVKKLKEKVLFQKGKETNEIAKFNEYLRKYPNGVFASEVKKLKEKALFQKGKKTNDIEKFNEYLTKYPNGVFASEVKRLREKEVFQRAKKWGSIWWINQYLADYPNGVFVSEVERLREEAEVERLKKETVFEKIDQGSFRKSTRPNELHVDSDVVQIQNIKHVLVPIGGELVIGQKGNFVADKTVTRIEGEMTILLTLNSQEYQTVCKYVSHRSFQGYTILKCDNGKEVYLADSQTILPVLQTGERLYHYKSIDSLKDTSSKKEDRDIAIWTLWKVIVYRLKQSGRDILTLNRKKETSHTVETPKKAHRGNGISETMARHDWGDGLSDIFVRHAGTIKSLKKDEIIIGNTPFEINKNTKICIKVKKRKTLNGLKVGDVATVTTTAQNETVALSIRDGGLEFSASISVAATPARKFSEKAFFKKIERIDPVVPDIWYGDIPLIKGDDSSIANAGQIIALLHKECIKKKSHIGIGELRYWGKSVLVEFIDNKASDTVRDKLISRHMNRSNKRRRYSKNKPFTIICTVSSLFPLKKEICDKYITKRQINLQKPKKEDAIISSSPTGKTIIDEDWRYYEVED